MNRLWALLVGAAFTDLGGGLFQLALPWLVYDVTRSAFWLGAVATVQGVSLWLLPVLGIWVDRYDRRRLLVLALVGQAAAAGGLALLVAGGRAGIPIILLSAVMMTVAQRLQLLAGSAARRVMTPVAARMRFNSWWAIVTLLASYGAPGLAGFLLQWQGVSGTLAILAASVLPMLLAVLWLPDLRGERDLRTPWTQLSASFRQLTSETGLWRYTMFFAYWGWIWSGAMAVIVYFYRHTLHFSAAEVGLAGLAGGVLPVLLSVAGPRIVSKVGPGWLLTGGLIVSGLGMVVLPSFSGPLMVGGVLGFIDGPVGPILAALSTISQHRISGALYGRVMAVRGLVAQSLTPVIALAAGSLAAVYGAAPVIQGLGGLAVAGGILAPVLQLHRVTINGEIR